jgi:hypothetical protein
MTLGEKQELFSKCFAQLILEMYARGYTVRLGDVFAIIRNPLEHKSNSQHYVKCAGDVNLFKDGKWLQNTNDHKVFGDFWESLNPLCRWGGRWSDGNHYEIKP